MGDELRLWDEPHQALCCPKCDVEGAVRHTHVETNEHEVRIHFLCDDCKHKAVLLIRNKDDYTKVGWVKENRRKSVK